jgi:hypothetical protein
MQKFKVNDRVRRIPFKVVLPSEEEGPDFEANGKVRTTTTSSRGCIGTVKALREETTGGSMSSEARERSIMVQVLWDNGTVSFLGPEGLESAA